MFFTQGKTNHCVLHAINNAFGKIMISKRTMDYAHQFEGLNADTKRKVKKGLFDLDVAFALLSRLGYAVKCVKHVGQGLYVMEGNYIDSMKHVIAYRDGQVFDSLMKAPMTMPGTKTALKNIHFKVSHMYKIVPGTGSISIPASIPIHGWTRAHPVRFEDDLSDQELHQYKKMQAREHQKLLQAQASQNHKFQQYMDLLEHTGKRAPTHDAGKKVAPTQPLVHHAQRPKPHKVQKRGSPYKRQAIGSQP